MLGTEWLEETRPLLLQSQTATFIGLLAMKGFKSWLAT